MAFEVAPELRALDSGVAFAVVPIATVRDLAARFDSMAAGHLARPPTPGHLWTLVVLPATVAAAPLTWDEPGTTAAEISAPLPDASGLAAFLRRWPETAHLAARLDPKPGARGKVTFDLGVTIEVLEAFVQAVDVLSIAHPDMRADADKARGALPQALRARLLFTAVVVLAVRVAPVVFVVRVVARVVVFVIHDERRRAGKGPIPPRVINPHRDEGGRLRALPVRP